MNTIGSYGSDDESPASHLSQSPEKQKGVGEDNYDNITMDMSDDSSPNEPCQKSRSESSSSRTSSSSSNSRSPHDGHLKRSSKKDSYHRSDDRSQHSDSPDYHKGGNRDADRRRSYRDDKDRDHRDREERRNYRHSRSPSYHRYERSRKSRSRSPRDRSRDRSRDRTRHSSRRDYLSPSRRRRDHRDRSRGDRTGGGSGPGAGGPGCDRKASKLLVLEKLGIELKLPEAEKDGSSPLALPSYYNPVAMNPAKYAEQIAKRKLLWANKQKQGEKVEPSESKTASVWQGARFSQDQDGKLTAKFQRLMGIKKDSTSGDSSSGSQGKQDLLKKQEELFSTMELQYEVARQATHTQRGVGLGFGAHHYPK